MPTDKGRRFSFIGRRILIVEVVEDRRFVAVDQSHQVVVG